MSKQSENKEKQGFRKEHPSCVNCKNFTCESKEKKIMWSDRTVIHETNLRCGVGGFAVGKSNWCTLHKFK